MKNLEYHVVAAIRKVRTATNCPEENHSQTMLKMSSISDLKRPTATKNTRQFNTMPGGGGGTPANFEWGGPRRVLNPNPI